jgi:hypothetical protein
MAAEEFVLKLVGSYRMIRLEPFSRLPLIRESDMNNFEYFNPARIIFGAGESKRVGSEAFSGRLRHT